MTPYQFFSANSIPELHIAPGEALEVFKVVRPSQAEVKGQSALDLLEYEHGQGYVVSFCAGVDEVMGGGVEVGRVTEVCGEPGTGKTQLRLVSHVCIFTCAHLHTCRCVC